MAQTYIDVHGSGSVGLVFVLCLVAKAGEEVERLGLGHVDGVGDWDSKLDEHFEGMQVLHRQQEGERIGW
jgi:hypothetical protein